MFVNQATVAIPGAGFNTEAVSVTIDAVLGLVPHFVCEKEPNGLAIINLLPVHPVFSFGKDDLRE